MVQLNNINYLMPIIGYTFYVLGVRCIRRRDLTQIVVTQRCYSTSSSSSFPWPCEKYYENPDKEKKQILSENEGLTGIYLWKNKINNKIYVGSGFNISSRLRHYYSSMYMKGVLKRSNSIIFSAILKHGLENFSLSILEYCLPEEQFKREDYYLTTLQPEYNILQKANTSLGYKHSEESKAKMRELNRKHPKAQAIEVLDMHTNEINNYDSILAVSKALNIYQATISNYLSYNQKKPWR